MPSRTSGQALQNNAPTIPPNSFSYIYPRDSSYSANIENIRNKSKESFCDTLNYIFEFTQEDTLYKKEGTILSNNDMSLIKESLESLKKEITSLNLSEECEIINTKNKKENKEKELQNKNKEIEEKSKEIESIKDEDKKDLEKLKKDLEKLKENRLREKTEILEIDHEINLQESYYAALEEYNNEQEKDKKEEKKKECISIIKTINLHKLITLFSSKFNDSQLGENGLTFINDFVERVIDVLYSKPKEGHNNTKDIYTDNDSISSTTQGSTPKSGSNKSDNINNINSTYRKKTTQNPYQFATENNISNKFNEYSFNSYVTKLIGEKKDYNNDEKEKYDQIKSALNNHIIEEIYLTIEQARKYCSEKNTEESTDIKKGFYERIDDLLKNIEISVGPQEYTNIRDGQNPYKKDRLHSIRKSLHPLTSVPSTEGSLEKFYKQVFEENQNNDVGVTLMIMQDGSVQLLFSDKKSKTQHLLFANDGIKPLWKTQDELPQAWKKSGWWYKNTRTEQQKKFFEIAQQDPGKINEAFKAYTSHAPVAEGRAGKVINQIRSEGGQKITYNTVLYTNVLKIKSQNNDRVQNE